MITVSRRQQKLFGDLTLRYQNCANRGSVRCVFLGDGNVQGPLALRYQAVWIYREGRLIPTQFQIPTNKSFLKVPLILLIISEGVSACGYIYYVVKGPVGVWSGRNSVLPRIWGHFETRLFCSLGPPVLTVCRSLRQSVFHGSLPGCDCGCCVGVCAVACFRKCAHRSLFGN